jgi:effector-binding domain-containing protein
MTLLKKIGLVAGLLVVLLLVGAYLLPREVRVEREARIDAPVSTVFALVDGFGRFNDWSPWAARDPEARYTYEGPRRDVGERMSWEGDPDTVGSGSQTLVERVPWEKIGTELDFGPEGKATATLSLSPDQGATRVRWSFETDLGMNPVGRWMSLFMDRWIGSDYEQGLANLKRLAEGLPKTDFRGLEWSEVQVQARPVAYVEASCGKDEREIAATMASAYARVSSFLNRNGLDQAGPPLTINHEWGDAGYRFDAALPLTRVPDVRVPVDSPVRVKSTYAGRALRAVHRGSYTTMAATYEQLFSCAAAYGYERAGSPWDEFVTDPTDVPAAEPVTNVYLPVR